MKDAKGGQRLALRTMTSRFGEQYVVTHLSVPVSVMERVQEINRVRDNRSISKTVSQILADALSDDAVTPEEGRIILRGLKGLADRDADESTMDVIEGLTAKLERVFPRGVA